MHLSGRFFRAVLALALALTMSLSILPVASAEGDKTVTIGITGTISTLNPLQMDATEVVKYASSLVFLPLVELNQDMQFVPQLAESITTVTPARSTPAG